MTADKLLAMPLAEALEKLLDVDSPPRVRVVAASPPKGAKTAAWRVARVVGEDDGTVVVTAVAEIEGTIGCNEPLAQN